MTKNRALLVALAGTFASLAACRNGGTPVDESLQRDLSAAGSSSAIELAPNGARSQAVDLEDAPKAAPAPAIRHQTPRPVQHPAPRLAAQQPPPEPSPAPAPAPRTTVTQSAPPAPSPAPSVRDVPPLPPAKSSPAQGGGDRTEAEIFRRMPWIRP